MLLIKSKVMKSTIQWCKNFAPGACLGVTRGQNRILGPFFFVTQLLLGFLSPVEEDWRNAFGILMCKEICNGTRVGICDGAPSTCSSNINFRHAE